MVRVTHALLALASLVKVSGHGFISNPEMRGRKRGKYQWEPQSLGATGGGAAIPVCGREDANVGTPKNGEPLTLLPRGKPYTFETTIKAHHMGHMTLRLCPLLLLGNDYDTDALDQCVFLKRSRTGPGTDDKYPIDPANPELWFLPPGKGVHSMTFDIPSKLPASDTGAYTIQYRWETANSCNPNPKAYKSFFGKNPGLQSEWCGGICKDWGKGLGDKCTDEMCCSEVFTNCADVRFEGVTVDADLLRKLASTTPKKPTPVPRPGPRPPSVGGNGACFQQLDCDKSAWCADKSFGAYCLSHFKNEKDCNAVPQCVWKKKGSGKPQPTPEPEPETETPEPEPEHEDEEEPEPEPEDEEHEVVANKNAAAHLKGLSKFCELNKDYFCSTGSTVVYGANLCQCSPKIAPQPTPPPVRPVPRPAPSPQPSPGPVPFKKCTACKSECQRACGGNVAINQCWGSPRYTECKCKNGKTLAIQGCPCKNKQQCKALLIQDHTKVSDNVLRSVMEHAAVDADGSLLLD